MNAKAKPAIVFASDLGHVNAAVSGGVQVCTREYVDLLEAAGLDVAMFTVSTTRRWLPRLKIKLGVEAYDRYDFDALFGALVALIDQTGARLIALNQLMLIGFAPLLRRRYGDSVEILVLSHGNESGDFLHELTRRSATPGHPVRFRDVYRLGSLIRSESQHFIHDVDHVLALSETELEINKWLGAKSGLFIPRTFRSVDIGWAPVLNRVGFVGSLNHKPNYDGLVALVEELHKRGPGELKVRVVGGPPEVGHALARQYPVIEFVGHVPDAELEREAATWAMFVNPVLWYSRGASTKLATAINWGLPLISTPAGNRGYTWTDGDLLTVNTAAEMAERVLATAGDVEEIRKLARETSRVASSGPSLAGLGAALRSRLRV
jgi:glycosyltransferase involved in cell wall biosynthesis